MNYNVLGRLSGLLNTLPPKWHVHLEQNKQINFLILFLFLILISDSLDNVQVTANSPIPMPQVALGLIPNKDVVLPEQVSAEQVTLQFQKKLEDLEQQVQHF